MAFEIRSTRAFDRWKNGLRDLKARAIIAQRLDRLAHGNPGLTKSVGSGVIEMKIDFGPGYRVYYMQRDRQLILLLCGGDKSSQRRDIEHAKQLAADFQE